MARHDIRGLKLSDGTYSLTSKDVYNLNDNFIQLSQEVFGNSNFSKGIEKVVKKNTEDIENIKQTADSLTIAFNSQKFGAGNLIKNGRGNFGVNSWQSGYPGTMFDSVTDAITRRDCGEGNIIRFGNSNADEKYIFQHGIPLKSGTTYTLNMLYWVGDRCKGMDVYIIGQKASATPGTNPYDYIREVLKDTTYSDTAYEKLTYTFTTEADEDRCFLRIDNEGSTDGVMRYVYFMAWLEEGNKETPWKPNHDEIQAVSHRFDATGYYMLDSNGAEIMSLSKGVANEQNIGRVDNVESGFPMKIPFHIGSEVSQITQAVLKWDMSQFRTYSKGAAEISSVRTTPSGGGSTSGSGGSSTVSVKDWTQGLAASTSNATITSSNLGQPHYHTVSTANLGHSHDIPSHTHSTPSHSHSVDITHDHAPVFGILETGITVDYTVGIEIDGVYRAQPSGTRGIIDLSAWITTNGWHEIRLYVNGIKRLDANLFLKTYIRR